MTSRTVSIANILLPLLLAVACCIRPTHAAGPKAICGLIGEQPLLLRRNETTGELSVDPFLDGEEPSNRFLLRRAPSEASSLASLAHRQRQLQEEEVNEVAIMVRQCPCAFTEEPVYCEIQYDACEVTSSGKQVCWKATVSRFIGNLFPFVFFWFAILFIVLICTRRGRHARSYMIRNAAKCICCRCFCCCKRSSSLEPLEQDPWLNHELDRLLQYQPDHIGNAAQNYRVRMRRRFNRYLQRSTGESVTAGDEMATTTEQQQQQEPPQQEPGIVEGRLQPSLMLKIRKYHVKGCEEDDNICTICLGSMQEGSRVGSLLACQHDFHVDCLKGWLKRKNHCPLCNKRAAELRYSTFGVDDTESAE